MSVDELLTRLGTSGPDLLVALVSAVGIYAVVIVATRLAGLRSFSKMSAFDFAMTVAVGSVIASTASGHTPLASSALAIAALYGLQYGVARLRRRDLLRGAVDNTPTLLMDGPQVLHANLAEARITLDDLHGKLREANVLDPTRIRAVVLETTGDISVLHGEGPLDPELLRGVRRE